MHGEGERERDSLAFTYHSDLESWLVSLANNPVSWYRMYNFCKPCFWNVFEKVKSWSYLTSHSRFTMFYPHFAEGLVSCCWSARSWGDRLMWGLKAFHHTDSFCVATDQEKHWKKLKPFGRSIHNFAQQDETEIWAVVSVRRCFGAPDFDSNTPAAS